MLSRRFPIVLVAALLPLALTACGSGRSPHVYEERPTVDAANASVGDLAVRNVSVTPPEAGTDEFAVGESATATASIVNLGEAVDRLESVTTEAATTVELVGADGAVADKGVVVPSLGAIGAGDFSIRLSGLTQALRPGQHVDMTFTFTRAGRMTLTVPVEVYTSPAPRPTVNVFEEHEGEQEG